MTTTELAQAMVDLVNEATAPLKKRIAELETKQAAAPTTDAVLSRALQAVDERLKQLPKPRDGRDGKDGRDGTSVTVTDVLPMLQAAVEKAADAIPRPRDGRDGKDGADGFSLDDFDIEHDPDHGYRVRFVRGDLVKERSVAWPFDAGVYQSGKKYPAGACVTFRGQYCIALRQTSDEPMSSKAWRLVVKAGRDGKPGRDGRDLREESYLTRELSTQ